ncbi:hypothetical protein CBR_g39399 [Chara braunii]|uniref:Uncharacterized protein n=1 Tax=Chara braunii TaxID=69332 RepID=A0A388LRH7_CHABU|nr:hypothetical protein CBR_g39399 [Chara braunii]|eukprot:GBG84936.1 hypothetical protein CBR_g39399 [Chara braunii]
MLNVNGWRDGKKRKKSRRKGRQERGGRRKRCFEDERVVRFSAKEDVSSVKPTSIIERLKGKKHRELTSSGGKIWGEDWSVVRRRYGGSDLVAKGKTVKLRSAKICFEEGGVIQLSRIHERKPGDSAKKKLLHQMLRLPWARKKLKKLGIGELAELYSNIGSFSSKETRKTLKNIVDCEVKARFKISFRRKIVVWIRYDERVSRAEVRRVMQEKINRQHESAAVAKLRCQKLQSVWRKNQTIGQLLHNHREFSRQMVVVCICADFDLPKQEGHIIFRLSTRGDVCEKLFNAKNVVRAVDCEKKEVALCRELNDALLKAGFDDPWTLQQARGCLRAQNVHEAGLIDRIWELKERWRELVFSPLDKNPTETVVLCPTKYAEEMKKMFWRNAAFEAVWEKEEKVMVQARREFEEKGLSKIGQWDKKGVGREPGEGLPTVR